MLPIPRTVQNLDTPSCLLIYLKTHLKQLKTHLYDKFAEEKFR